MIFWSKWLDYRLQQLKSHVSSYLKDGQQLLDDLKEINLPPNTRLFTADTVSMYNNIDTEHAIDVISWWLESISTELGPTFPLEAVKAAMKIIMRNNIFEWGDLYFLQLLGTAMGTSAAVMWATIYYAYHEEHTILPRYKPYLCYYKRFIDDIFGIWTLQDGDDDTAWTDFCADLNRFGILTWEIQEPSHQVDFLDLTISIVGPRLETKTFQKALNLYLYLPPTSAHPTGCIKGTIYGLINRYYHQNTHRRDYIYYAASLYKRLLQRGWGGTYIKPIILQACEKMERRSGPDDHPNTAAALGNSTVESSADRLFIHLQYHPDDIPRRELQQLYDKHCAQVFQREIGLGRPTIAYSRPRNIGEYVTQAKYHQAPGREASVIMG